MRWTPGGESQDVEDRRDESGGGSEQIPGALLKSIRRGGGAVAGIAETFVMLAKQKLIRHSCDVVANNNVPHFPLRKLFIECRHRARSCEVVGEKLFQTFYGAVAVLRDGRMIINVLEEKAFELRIARFCRLAETAKTLGGTANIVRRGRTGGKHPLPGGFKQV